MVHFGRLWTFACNVECLCMFLFLHLCPKHPACAKSKTVVHSLTVARHHIQIMGRQLRIHNILFVVCLDIHATIITSGRLGGLSGVFVHRKERFPQSFPELHQTLPTASPELCADFYWNSIKFYWFLLKFYSIYWFSHVIKFIITNTQWTRI